MSDYEPFEPTQGDPWSTEPVADYSQRRRELDPDGYQEESQVLARMPHVSEEPASDHYRGHGRSGNSHRRHRSSSPRSGIPAPVWVVVGMGLVVLIASPFFMSRNSGNEALVEMPAPDADLAPTWSAGDANSQWQQPGTWPPEPTATATAEPINPAGLNPTSDWVGAPANAPYAYNAGMAMPAAGDQNMGNFGPGSSSDPSGRPAPATPGVGWDTSVAPITPNDAGGLAYDNGGRPPVSSYPATGAVPPMGWSDGSAAPLAAPAPSYEAMQPAPSVDTWDRSPNGPSLSAPQPENVMPGYGAYPSAQANPYVGNPSPPAPVYQDGYAGTPADTRGAPAQYPHYTDYPAAGQPPAQAYLIPNAGQTPAQAYLLPNPGQTPAQAYPVPYYPQTAMSPNPVAPDSSLPAASRSLYPAPAVPSYSYPPTATNPYTPQAAPGVPAGQPYQGTGVSNEAPQQSVARLNGTIQEPVARNAYDDRARPSYY